MSEKIKTRTVKRNIKSLHRSVATVDGIRRKVNQAGKEQEEDGNPVIYAEDNMIFRGYAGVAVGVQEAKKGVWYVRKQIKAKSSGVADITDGNLAGESNRFGGADIVHSLDDNGRIKKKKKDTVSVPKCKNRTGIVKNNPQMVKTAVHSRKTVVKTKETVAKTGKRAAQRAVRNAQKSAQRARKTRKETRQMAKLTARAVKNAVLRVMMAAKTITTLILSGGWIAIAIILFILMIGLVVNSAFGIFFSGDDKTRDGQSMSEVVAEINLEYQKEIDTIKKKKPYDVLELSGVRATWKDVLSVYAVRTNTDKDHPQDVATMDEEKKELLRTIFWKMNVISHHTEKKKEKIKDESDDGRGNIHQKEKEVTRTYLYIKVIHKSADEMAEEYTFDKNQKEQLVELLAGKNDNLWASVLNGVSYGSGDGNIVAVAKSQIGNVGGEPYWRWYGFNSRVSWCACFVSWCANQCGYIESGVIPRFSLCTDGVGWFRRHKQWQGREYAPAQGDIIFFDWDGDGKANHVGIVESVSKGKINTVEGNSGDAVRRRSYPIGGSGIYGYGIY